MEVRRIAEVASYHAHIYFDPETERPDAVAIREAAGERFAVRLGAVHDRPVGPHSKAMFQIAFEPELFGTLMPWLMLNNRGLSILVHPNTANEKRDHLIDAAWIGRPLAVDEGPLPEATEPQPAGEVNTAPTVAP
ncbi:MAG TPA: DOPA 4,5-dioxygenase family protein [Allosphingosinicella sp.]|nr:DOPA 4,5-dioxygenase family protein [Allosphingosinicella sp.]